ncbi:MAG: hypothetical protein U1A23_03645 [Candidatus Sungbacteria bacterium]|nr:hypothetical protein [bacterium]MDZ4285995.1 hypothetical protein [Candidatus Sungbacteria bacterium]
MKTFLLYYLDEKPAYHTYVLALVPAESLEAAAQFIGGTLPFQPRQGGGGQSGIVVLDKKHFVKLPIHNHTTHHVLEQEKKKWGGYAVPQPTSITLYLYALPVIHGQISFDL